MKGSALSVPEVVFGFGAHSGIFPGRITDRPLAATRDRAGRWIGGSIDQWVEELTGAVLEHGASGFTLFPARGGAQDIVSLGRWAREIVPAVREAIAKENR
jgi:hypothetical protein